MDTLKVRIVQKAWEDPEFKAQLLADPGNALQASFGVTLPEGMELHAVEETPSRVFLVIPSDPADKENPGGGRVAYVWS